LGLIAIALLVVAFGDVVLHNGFTLIPPAAAAILVAIVVAFLLHEFMVARQRTEMLDRQTAQLRSASARLEQSLAAANKFNVQLNQSEARYKGLVDAQGDAIFRRAPDSRLTYGNEAFFKLFGLVPQRSVGRPFAPELHPDSRAPLFGSFAGLESGRGRVRYDQHVRTAYGWRWIAWEDFAVRDANLTLFDEVTGLNLTAPRAGLSKKVVHRIIDASPKRIVYVSCNPTTLAPNAAELVEAGWTLRKVRPVDMFPQTHHIECVALFERT